MNDFIVSIKKIAAMNQKNMSVKILKEQIDVVVKNYANHINTDLENEKDEWKKIYEELGKFISVTSSPEWLTVIKIARKKINQKRHTKVYQLKKVRIKTART